MIYVAGTKGKGSTCAFIGSFLLAHGARTGFPRKIGPYTSPDLVHLRERIQINDKSIPEDLFTWYFFEVWDRPSTQCSRDDPDDYIPRCMQLLILTALHSFIREGVEAAIIETHHGGEFDPTNVVQSPAITGITTLGLDHLDHLDHLGPTIENIA